MSRADRSRRGGLVALALIALVGCQNAPGRAVTRPPVPSSPGPTVAAVGPDRPENRSAPLDRRSPIEVCAQRALDRMDLPSRVGQLVMVGVPAGNPAAGAPTVATYRLGGVFLAGRSRAGVARTRAAVDALQHAAGTGPGLEVALDQEGGLVSTLTGPGIQAAPTAVRQGREPSALLRSTTARWSAQLRAAGVTLDLAPVSDTVAATDKGHNPPIGAYDREYGGTPTVVAARVSTVVTAMSSAGLAATLKHFPGLGRVRTNTDVSAGAIDRQSTTTDPNLAPFAAGIRAGAAAVMVSSASYPKLDRANLAVFSRPIISGLLRTQMGFGELVLSDDLGSAAAIQSVPVGRRATAFVAAGGDIALTVRRSDAGPMTAELLRRARTDPAFHALADRAALRVLTSKARRHLLTCT